MRTENDNRPDPTQRIGRFTIPLDFIRHDWRLLQKFMREVVVVTAQYDYSGNQIEYTAISDLFESNPANTEAPFYVLEFLTTEVRRGDRLCFETTGDYTLTREK